LHLCRAVEVGEAVEVEGEVQEAEFGARFRAAAEEEAVAVEPAFRVPKAGSTGWARLAMRSGAAFRRRVTLLQSWLCGVGPKANAGGVFWWGIFGVHHIALA
jgi:hypothetical protein